MSTTPLTDAINALTQYANETTGASDTTLSDAVGTLVAGYGGGGGLTVEDVIERTNFPETIVYEGTSTLLDYVMAYLTGVKSFTATKNIGVNSYAFYNCRGLVSVSMPLVNSNANSTNVFRSCTSLENVDLPLIRYLGSSYFRTCTSLETIVLPSVITLASDVWNGCSKLNKADFSNVTSLPISTFTNTNLEILVLRKSTITTLGSVGAFNGCPFASGKSGGTLYVPNALISSYQSASQWSTILGYANNQIKAIEGSYYETHYADGTVIQ